MTTLMTSTPRRGFVRAEGTRLVDDGGPVQLRGIGLGNWLLAEGYMWQFGDDMSSPRQIERRVAELIGPERAATFWRRFRDSFITEADFAQISAAGFDHVRLPINARGVIDDDGELLEEGFAYIDRAVAWSERHGLRILLDLHGAPGGQTGTNIDDSPRGAPELFTSPRYRALTVRLWQELARRYRDRESVLGYDLLNEPLPNEWQYRYHDELIDTYRELTAAIREIDDRHLLMYEGSHWATNPAPVSVRYDENQAVQFHRYWCPPDQTSIADFLALRRDLGAPIYMGEGGENTPQWVYAATRLYERHDIGWNFWPWKKLNTLTSPLSARLPSGWGAIADPEQRPDPDESAAILEEFLEGLSVDRCDVRTPILRALFAEPDLDLPAWAGRRDDAETALADLVCAELPADIWHHTSGAPYAENEFVPVDLEPGQHLSFDLAREPRAWSIDADLPHAVSGRWDRGSLTLSTTALVRIRKVVVRT